MDQFRSETFKGQRWEAVSVSSIRQIALNILTVIFQFHQYFTEYK